MKTTTKFFTRLASLVLIGFLTVGLDSCNKIEEPIIPSKKGARNGVTPSVYPPPGFYYEGDELTNTPVPLKTVGQSASIDEETDFRLYPTAIQCQAYEYLFLHAFATGSREVGAYITSRGIVLGPNNRGEASHYRFRTWGNESNDRTPFLYTDNGNITINGMMHTYPGGTSSPSPDDVLYLAQGYDIPQYIVTSFDIYKFTANGTTTHVATYNEKKCP